MRWVLRLFAFLLMACVLSTPVEAQEWSAVPIAADFNVAMAPPPAFPSGWTVSDGIFTQVGGHTKDADTVAAVLRHAERSIPAFAEKMGVASGRRLRIYVVRTAEQFQSLQPGSPPSWADATAWPHRGLIFLRAPRLRPGTADPLLQVLDHEIVHAVLGQAFGPRSVPRWLQEGLAQVLAGEYTPSVTREIARHAVGRGLYSLEELSTGFPTDPMGARLAYAQAADFVVWLNAQGRKDAVRALVRELARGRALGAAVRTATGRSLDDVDADWRERWSSGGMKWTVFADGGLFWGFAAFALAVGAINVRRRNQRRLAVWAKQEAFRDELLRRTIERWQEAREAERVPEPPAPIWDHPLPFSDEDVS